MLEIKDLTVEVATSHGKFKVLDNVNLSIQSGEKWGLVGESGSGKSTLALTIMGLAAGKIEGSVCFKGEELLSKSTWEWEKIRGSSISMVMQQSGEMLTPTLTLGEQVMEPYFKKYPHNSEKAREKAIYYLEKVGLEESFFYRYPFTLSGGEVQRALLAMALITDPELLILDEPVSSLDARTKSEILKLLNELTKDCTVLAISHDLATVLQLTEYTGVLYCGSLMETGPTEKCLQEPAHPYTRALVRAYPTIDGTRELQGIRGDFPPLSQRPSGCPFHTRCTQVLEVCSHERPIPVPVANQAISASASSSYPGVITGAKGEEAYYKSASQQSAAGNYSVSYNCSLSLASGNTLADTTNKSLSTWYLSCHRGGIIELLRGEGIIQRFSLQGESKRQGKASGSSYVEAVSGVNVKLREGEVYALVGESGSGKTTLGRILAGVDFPYKGDVFYQQQNLNQIKGKKEKSVRRQLQILFQNSGQALSHRLNVYELVSEPLEIQKIGDYYSRREVVIKSLEWVNLPTSEHFLNEYPHHLSGGELQRVAIARALVLEPRVLIADEPSASLDASVQAKIIKLLLYLQNEKGFALFLITHDLALAAKAGDRMGVMHSGKIIEEGPPAKVINNPKHSYTKSLLNSGFAWNV